jgi:hypothetical protein
VSFWAKASQPHTQLGAAALLAVPPWTSLGLNAGWMLNESWAQYSAEFECVQTTSTGKLSFDLGAVGVGTSVWVFSPQFRGTRAHPPVLRRDFEHGVVLLNGDTVPRTITLSSAEAQRVGAGAGEDAGARVRGWAGAGRLRRLTGKQAPLYQYIVDDNSTAQFAVSAGRSLSHACFLRQVWVNGWLGGWVGGWLVG